MTDIDKALQQAVHVLSREAKRPIPAGSRGALDPEDVAVEAERLAELKLALEVVDKVRARRALLSQLELEDPTTWLELRDQHRRQFVGAAREDPDIGIESLRELHLIEKAYKAGYDRGART